MRKLFSSVVLALFMSFSLIPIEVSIAADSSAIVGFEIIAPSTAKSNEAIDITVRAIDKDKKTVTDYQGSIIFISDTFGDTVPSPGKAIAFTLEDAGQKKFSKGVIFRSTGKQKIYVADVNNSNDVIGETTITVSAADSTGPNTGTETVTIVTPAQNATITSDMIAVSGKTKQNSKVSFILNGKDLGTAISDADGLFTKTLSGITQEKSLLQVNLLDGTNAIIGQSEEIVFSRAPIATGFSNLVITPGTTVDISTPITLLVEGDAGMSSVSVAMDGSLIVLTENQAGQYKATTAAPAKAGSYPLTVSMVTSLGQTIDQKDVATLTVTEPVQPSLVPRFANIKTMTEGKKATFMFTVIDAPVDLDKFKIAYGENADSLSQEVMTYATGKIQGTGGVYTWYVDNLDTKTYTFKIFGAKANNSLIPDLVSDPIIVTIGKDAISVANIANLVIANSEGKSVMSWDKVECALSYNVYKITPAGDYELVQNIKEPTYTIFHQTGSVTYSDFAVKALCEGGVESADFTEASAVQTGPGAIAILVIISGIFGMLILRKKSLS